MKLSQPIIGLFEGSVQLKMKVSEEGIDGKSHRPLGNEKAIFESSLPRRLDLQRKALAHASTYGLAAHKMRDGAAVRIA